MTDPTQGMVRLARAGALTLAAGGLSLGAHGLAGGVMPSYGGLLGLLVPLLALHLLVTAHRLRLPMVALLFALTQLALHHAFEALASGPGHGGAMPPSFAMTLFHGAAAVATVALLAHGERSLWRLWSWLAPALPTVSRVVGAFPFVASAPAVRRAPRAPGAVRRPRGPPVLSALG